MTTISINTVHVANFNGKRVDVKDVTNDTCINNARDRALSSILVTGYGLKHADALWQAVCSVVADFEDDPVIPEVRIMTTQEKEKKINELRREEEEESTARQFSRECRICFSTSPKARAVLTACGHTACMACVLTMEVDGRLDCPYCRKKSGYVKLHEEQEEMERKEENKDEKKRKEKKIVKIKSALASLKLPSRKNSTTSSVNRPTVSRPTVPPRTVSLPRLPPPTVSRPTTNSTVRIGNLPHSTTVEELRELLSIVGEVVNISLAIDRFLGCPRGYIHCQFASESSAQDAVHWLHGHNGMVVRLRH